MPFKCSSPASVISAPVRLIDETLVGPLRCEKGVSLTFVSGSNGVTRSSTYTWLS
jgi:hypothetical protein